MEEWALIDGFPNYCVSTYGRVYSRKRGIILKQFHDAWGYLCVSPRNEQGQRTSSVARLVAKAFIPNPYNKPEVNHIDGNKENNNISNLEWVTGAENKRHAIVTGLNIRSTYDAGRPKRKIRDIDTGEVFDSIAECAKALNCTHSNIVDYFKRGGILCKGHRLELLN